MLFKLIGERWMARRTNWWICSRFPMKRENKKLLRAEKSNGKFLR